MKERLQKYLARAGIASRRKAEQMILDGRVKVNNKLVKELGTLVSPETDVVSVDGKPVQGAEKKIYLMLNKPIGIITSVKDEQNRPTVMDFVKAVPQRIFPVGRLDRDSEGLLLLTNDGSLAYKLTHPKYEISKTYQVLVKGRPGKKALDFLRKGIVLNGRKTSPALVKILRQLNKETLVEISIHEGRNRQVRRMFAQIGHPVVELKRTKFSFLELGDLASGQYRYLSTQEIQKLKQLFGKYQA